jgi:hypothetical protein
MVPGFVTPRPRVGLGRVLDDLGATLLTLAHGDPGRAEEIGGVVLHDPLDDLDLPRRALVLGIGLRTNREIIDLLGTLAERGAVALVVREPVPSDAEVRAAVEASGVALLGLTRGASWSQLTAMLDSLIAEGDVGADGPETLGGMPSGDLFALANAVAALVDAPITIEDRHSRVLAYSGRQEEADPSRIATVLGRRVPEEHSRRLVERGVFRELYRSDEPVYIAPSPPIDDPAEFSMPRVAVAVRAGDEVLGSMWAAVRGPLTGKRSRAFGDAAKLVALHLLRVRAGADVARRLRADLLSTALEGGTGAHEALGRLRLDGQAVVVLAMGVIDAAEDPSSIASEATLAPERERLGDALAMHLAAFHPRAAVALVGDVIYGLLPAAGRLENAEEVAVRIGTEFLGRIGARVPAVIGVGPVATDVSGLARARGSADRALRVLLVGQGAQRVARLEDVQVEALLLDLRDAVAARGDRPTGPVARLLAYDEQHGTNLVGTFRAWADAFGDVAAASAALYVHPNTFRYRLRRLAEVGGIDLLDPEARFAAMLQLRVVVP